MYEIPYTTGMVALHVRLAEMDGYTFPKQRKRYNDIVAYMSLMKDMGDTANQGLPLTFFMDEAILTASDDLMSGTTYKTMKEVIEAESWMIPT